MGFSYHNNEVVFLSKNAREYQLLGGSYTITDFCVPEKEDPDHNIRIGLVTEFGPDGSMVFRVGQKASDTVADWFKSKIAANQNTFDKNPGSLYFAFIGTLVLRITGGLLGEDEAEFIFPGVALAMGTSGKNWWFGGTHCTVSGKNVVLCEGEGLGEPELFQFWRGGNQGVHNIDFQPVSIIDLATWMSGLSDSTRIDQIMMPGSHDAGMSETDHCDFTTKIVSTGYVETQRYSVGKQLDCGSRYFDVRVDWDYDELVTYHRTSFMGCNGQSIRSVLDQTVAFLKTNKTETAILKFSHVRRDKIATEKKLTELLGHYSAYTYTNPNNTVNLATIPLGEARGKMILVFDYEQDIDPGKGRFRYKDGYKKKSCSIQPGANLTVCDEYTGTSDYSKMKRDQIKKWNGCAGMGEGRLFLLSWTLTAGNPLFDPTIEKLARYANSRLPAVLHEQIIVNGAAKPNIVYIDYINHATCQSIIHYNFMR